MAPKNIIVYSKSKKLELGSSGLKAPIYLPRNVNHKKGRENVVVIRPSMECILQAEMLLLVWFIPSSLHFSNIIITSFFPPAKHCTLMRSPQTEVSFYSGGKILSAITHTKHILLMGAQLSYATVCKKDEDIIIPKIVDST